MESAHLPTVVVTTVVRSAHLGDSHGGIYLVDLESETCRQVVDWNDGSINWDGRGGGRGLRGIAFDGDDIYIAASDEIFVFDRDFRNRRSIRSPYLRLCHEIDSAGRRLYVTATEFDSILVFDFALEQFVEAFCIRIEGGQLRFSPFDPRSDAGPPRGDTVHLNSVCIQDGTIYTCGVGLGHLLAIRGRQPSIYSAVPTWTHNARPFRGGVLANSTGADAVVVFDRLGNPQLVLPVPRYDPAQLRHADLPADFARQAFARGLCVMADGLVIGGSSPATVSVYRLDPPARLKSVTISLDVREAVHGLEIWPFGRL